MKPRFRFAPTPSRPLHIGNAFAALAGWAMASRANGTLVLRIEDIDRARCRPEYEKACLDDLEWLGIQWDEGPLIGGAFGPYRQSERLAGYDNLMTRLAEKERAYACCCSRAEVLKAQRAPHLHRGIELPYPGTCRAPDRCVRHLKPNLDRGGLRLDVHRLEDKARVSFVDGIQGARFEDVRRTSGDFLLGRPGTPTYQLAVVADDISMKIDHVVRGRDLLGSTARQLLLFRALNACPPRFSHHGLLLDEEGDKFSKREHAMTMEGLRASGVSAERMIAAIGVSAKVFSSRIARANAEDFKEALATSSLSMDHPLEERLL